MNDELKQSSEYRTTMLVLPTPLSPTSSSLKRWLKVFRNTSLWPTRPVLLFLALLLVRFGFSGAVTSSPVFSCSACALLFFFHPVRLTASLGRAVPLCRDNRCDLWTLLLRRSCGGQRCETRIIHTIFGVLSLAIGSLAAYACISSCVSVLLCWVQVLTARSGH